MDDIPEIALSVRQPWAHAIIHFDKDVENRSWQAVKRGNFTPRRVAIHAAKGMTKAEFEEAEAFIDGRGWTCPGADALRRGQIIGSVEIYDIVSKHDSPWFFGPRGLLLRDPRPCQPIPAVGALGFFKWQPADWSIVPESAAWMLPKAPKLIETVKRLQPEPGLFD